jgi:hypothetical protein
MLHARIRDRTGIEGRARDALGRALLAAIDETSRELGAAAVFVYLPILEEIGAGDPSPGEDFF